MKDKFIEIRDEFGVSYIFRAAEIYSIGRVEPDEEKGHMKHGLEFTYWNKGTENVEFDSAKEAAEELTRIFEKLNEGDK